jgi:hypothetical protein
MQFALCQNIACKVQDGFFDWAVLLAQLTEIRCSRTLGIRFLYQRLLV